MKTVLDLEAGEAAKKSGMLDAELHAPLDWIQQATAKIRLVALRQEFVTSDDIWAEGLEHPREARALGPVFKRAQALGYVEPTEMFILTTQTKRHRAPIRVWKSKVFGHAPAAKSEDVWTKERVMASIRARAK